jgi:hypothetical protein
LGQESDGNVEEKLATHLGDSGRTKRPARRMAHQTNWRPYEGGAGQQKKKRKKRKRRQRTIGIAQAEISGLLRVEFTTMEAMRRPMVMKSW